MVQTEIVNENKKSEREGKGKHVKKRESEPRNSALDMKLIGQSKSSMMDIILIV
jgi:hypothetical protein